MKKYMKYIIGLLVAIIILAGCNSTNEPEDSGEMTEDGSIQVLTTTTMITDLVEIIGGEQVEVNGLMGPGIDPHSYRVTPSDITALEAADVVVYNGMNLEGQMGEIFGELEHMGKEVFVLEEMMIQEQMLGSEEEDMAIDPHVWFSVPLWANASAYITESFSTYDPENAEYYQKNNETYQAELEELDTYIRERIKEVPEDGRYLVTAHDAFGYFGEEYDFEVVALQGLNTQTEAGTGDVSQLADFIVDREIKAIFVETSVPAQTIEALQEAVEQRGWEVEIGGQLFSDALGDEEQNAETYIKMYKQNIDTIVDALN